MKKLLVTVLALMLAMGLAVGCSASDQSDTTESESSKTEAGDTGSSAEEDTGGAVTLEDFEAWIAEQPDTEWYSKVTSSEMATRLRKPTILLFVDAPSSEIQMFANTAGNDWASTDAGQTTGLRIVSNDGLVFQGGMPLWMEFESEVPGPAASPDDFDTWLDEAFGPASGDPVDEEWYAHITGSGPSADGTRVDALTDLDHTNPQDQELANVISDVLRLAKVQGVDNYAVIYGDGSYGIYAVYGN